ncbi:MAG: hypothetical protein KJ646_05220 [Nanoarchaeota archaeon]|nr:hypothetical protein [Nanoarchaeota archaeon]MBU4116938.1 hypothetical protein [Nanoarchaeota archaeon]
MEKETVFSSQIKYVGVFSLKDYYQFCYDWLTEQISLTLVEKKYGEKLNKDAKDIDIEWTASRKVTDYFKFELEIKYKIIALKNVEIVQNNAKIKTNQGEVKLMLKGNLIRDYDGKFEKDSFRKFLRSIYEKWIIASRVEQFEDNLAGECDEFLNQAKAFLDLEGKK